jgi:hypothetical protein
MARTAITVTEVTRAAGAQPAQQNSDTANNMQLAWNDGRVILELSAVTAETTYTFLIPGLIDGQTVPALSVACGVGVVKLVGPFPTGIYNQPDNTLSVNVTSANGRIRAYHF